MTIIGTGDFPHPITELAGHTGDTATLDIASGTITFTGVDLSGASIAGNSLLSAAWSGGSELPDGLAGKLASSLTSSVADSVGFVFSASDKTFDFLAEGETLTVVYGVTVTDSHGVNSTRPVTMIITGTEDVPTITSLTQAATITEIADLGPGENTAAHTASGAVTFNDVDLSDIETSSISGSQVTATLANGYALTAAQQAALVNAFSIGSASHNTVSGDGSIAWQYSISDGALDFLGANDIVKLAYTVQVDDGNGGAASQVVTITVHGTEDVPTITSLTQAATITEIADLGPGENTAAHTASGR